MAENTEMTFWDHLDALRGVLLKIAGVIVAFGLVAFCVMPDIFDKVIMAPCYPDFPFYRLLDWIAANSPMEIEPTETFNLSLVSTQLASQFYMHLSTSCWAAVVFAFPVIIYLLWGFISPALYPSEKRGIRRAFFCGNTMFYAGVACGYYLVFPLTLRFLATYSLSATITPMITLDSYMDNFFTLILLMGVVFELPLLAWLLGKMGFLTRSFFGKYRRHAIVALLIAAALITPTGDPFSLFAVFIPIYTLWEFSARLVPIYKPEPEPQTNTTA